MIRYSPGSSGCCFYEEWFEYALVGFDLLLKFIILFRPKPRLFWVRNEFVQIDGGDTSARLFDPVVALAIRLTSTEPWRAYE